MAQKTYLIQWVALLTAVQRYGGRWQAKMAAGLSPELQACVAELLAAVSNCLILFGQRPIE